jgi:hypothetical protein
MRDGRAALVVPRGRNGQNGGEDENEEGEGDDEEEGVGGAGVRYVPAAKVMANVPGAKAQVRGRCLCLRARGLYLSLAVNLKATPPTVSPTQPYPVHPPPGVRLHLDGGVGAPLQLGPRGLDPDAAPQRQGGRRGHGLGRAVAAVWRAVGLRA